MILRSVALWLIFCNKSHAFDVFCSDFCICLQLNGLFALIFSSISVEIRSLS